MNNNSFTALIPLSVFIIIFIGSGIYLNDFYKIPAVIAIIPAVIIAITLAKPNINEAIEDFVIGAGNKNIITMCFIFLFAGGFAAITQAIGGVDAIVSLGLKLIPNHFLLPCCFLICSIIATAMGTSMGTIAAIAPILSSIANSTSISPELMAGIVISGATFGDNLSIISDTTIASVKTQNCDLRSKMLINLKIALPAAVIVTIFYYFLDSNNNFNTIQADINWILTLPYFLIIALAMSGLNVFIVLCLGISSSLLIGLYNSNSFFYLIKEFYNGFAVMHEIFILSIFIGGLSYLLEKQGGINFILNVYNKINSNIAVNKFAKLKTKIAKLSIATITMITNFCTANNTITILLVGKIAKEISNNNKLNSAETASYLDIFSCVVQGILPYGAQALLLSSVFGISAVAVTAKAFYPLILACFGFIWIILS